MSEKVYAIRCFVDENRRLTDELSTDEAIIFRNTALHLIRYLEKNYSIQENSGENK